MLDFYRDFCYIKSVSIDDCFVNQSLSSLKVPEGIFLQALLCLLLLV